MKDCTGAFTGIESDTDKESAQMPDGYEPVPVIANVGQVGLNLFDCATWIIDNVTVIGGARMWRVMTAAEVPDEVNAEQNGDSYMHELVVDNAQIAQAFRAHGFVAELGTIQVGITDTGLTATVAVEGKLHYELTLNGPYTESDPIFTELYRTHWVNGTSPIWYDSTSDIGTAQTPYSGLVTATGGIVTKIALVQSVNGEVPVLGQPIQGKLRINFQPLETSA